MINRLIKGKINDLIFSIRVVEEPFSDSYMTFFEKQPPRRSSSSSSSGEDSVSLLGRIMLDSFGIVEEAEFEIQNHNYDKILTDQHEVLRTNVGASKVAINSEMLLIGNGTNDAHMGGSLGVPPQAMRGLHAGSTSCDPSIPHSSGPIDSLGPVVQIPWIDSEIEKRSPSLDNTHGPFDQEKVDSKPDATQGRDSPNLSTIPTSRDKCLVLSHQGGTKGDAVSLEGETEGEKEESNPPAAGVAPRSTKLRPKDFSGVGVANIPSASSGCRQGRVMGGRHKLLPSVLSKSSKVTRLKKQLAVGIRNSSKSNGSQSATSAEARKPSDSCSKNTLC